jgi:predicted nuclease with TOPRIM domain
VAKVTHSYDRIQETLRKRFAALADDFQERLRAVSLELSAVEGPLEEQQRQIESIQTRIPALSEALETVEAAETECVAAKVEENDYTVFTCQDLEFELELVVQSIAKKISFIDNQVCLVYFASFGF